MCMCECVLARWTSKWVAQRAPGSAFRKLMQQHQAAQASEAAQASGCICCFGRVVKWVSHLEFYSGGGNRTLTASV
eukprot:scaffold12324_cov18-Tisochrysis_lutea.AAC.2